MQPTQPDGVGRQTGSPAGRQPILTSPAHVGNAPRVTAGSPTLPGGKPEARQPILPGGAWGARRQARRGGKPILTSPAHVGKAPDVARRTSARCLPQRMPTFLTLRCRYAVNVATRAFGLKESSRYACWNVRPLTRG
jgi:hypothetical protein